MKKKLMRPSWLIRIGALCIALLLFSGIGMVGQLMAAHADGPQSTTPTLGGILQTAVAGTLHILSPSTPTPIVIPTVSSTGTPGSNNAAVPTTSATKVQPTTAAASPTAAATAAPRATSAPSSQPTSAPTHTTTSQGQAAGAAAAPAANTAAPSPTATSAPSPSATTGQAATPASSTPITTADTNASKQPHSQGSDALSPALPIGISAVVLLVVLALIGLGVRQKYRFQSRRRTTGKMNSILWRNVRASEGAKQPTFHASPAAMMPTNNHLLQSSPAVNEELRQYSPSLARIADGQIQAEDLRTLAVPASPFAQQHDSQPMPIFPDTNDSPALVPPLEQTAVVPEMDLMLEHFPPSPSSPPQNGSLLSTDTEGDPNLEVIMRQAQTGLFVAPNRE